MILFLPVERKGREWFPARSGRTAGMPRLAVLAGAAALVTAVAASASSAGSAASPRVAVPDLSPFTVQGTHFRPGERVRVAVTAPGTLPVRTVTASTLGAFSLRYAHILLGHCAAYSVRAVGSLGSHAALRVMPECANGPTQ